MRQKGALLLFISLATNLYSMQKQKNEIRDTFLQLIYTCGESYYKNMNPDSRNACLSNLAALLTATRKNDIQFDDQKSKLFQKKEQGGSKDKEVEISWFTLKSAFLREAITESHLPCVRELVKHIDPATCQPHENKTPVQLAKKLTLGQIIQSQPAQNQIKILDLLISKHKE